MAKSDDRQYREFLEILDDRQGTGSTLITSQLPVGAWHEAIPDPTVAECHSGPTDPQRTPHRTQGRVHA